MFDSVFVFRDLCRDKLLEKNISYFHAVLVHLEFLRVAQVSFSDHLLSVVCKFFISSRRLIGLFQPNLIQIKEIQIWSMEGQRQFPKKKDIIAKIV